MSEKKIWNVMVTGGGGYVGSVLVPKLLDAGHSVSVIDLFIYGQDVFGPHGDNARLRKISGDIRNPDDIANALKGCDAVIHLACISNDPSFDLDPGLGKSINFDCFRPMVRAAKDVGVKRFIYASSSSVYGLSDEPNVTESLALKPLTDYSKFKAMCEDVLDEEREAGFTTLTLRPATVCGYSRRLRLDLTVNILTNHAVNNDRITVFGGQQLRPNIHIEDMTDLYVRSLQYEDALIDGGVFNAGYENHAVMEIAEMVRGVVGEQVEIVTTPTDDHRSYHISSQKISDTLGFEPSHTIGDAIDDLVRNFNAGHIPNSMTDPVYYNIKRMQNVELS